MPIKYRCEFCNQRLSISRKMAGLIVPCPRCGQSNRIPDEETAGVAPESLTQQAREPAPDVPAQENVSPFFFAALNEDEDEGATPPLATSAGAKLPAPVQDRESIQESNPIQDPEPIRYPDPIQYPDAIEDPDPIAVKPGPDIVFSPAAEELDDPNDGLNRAWDGPTERMSRQHRAAAAFDPERDPAASEREQTAVVKRGGDFGFDANVDGDGEVPVAVEAPAFRFRRRAGGDEDEMDLTPMVDMTFLLLIFFMITASFTLQKSLPFPAPSSEQKGAAPQVMSLDELEDTAVIVRIDEKNQIFIDDDPLPDQRALTRTLRTVIRDRQLNEVVVSADDAALHETVVAVIDAANDVGAERIRMTSRAVE
jgi:biopolymer transport protein ExbD/phage FluMu protein Com